MSPDCKNTLYLPSWLHLYILCFIFQFLYILNVYDHTGPLLLCPMIAKICSICYLSCVLYFKFCFSQFPVWVQDQVSLVPCLVHAAGEGEKGDPCNNLPREEDGGDLLMQALCLDEKYKQVIIEKHTNVHHCNCLIITVQGRSRGHIQPSLVLFL